jgi:hypothetical protein
MIAPFYRESSPLVSHDADPFRVRVSGSPGEVAPYPVDREAVPLKRLRDRGDGIILEPVAVDRHRRIGIDDHILLEENSPIGICEALCQDEVRCRSPEARIVRLPVVQVSRYPVTTRRRDIEANRPPALSAVAIAASRWSLCAGVRAQRSP